MTTQDLEKLFNHEQLTYYLNKLNNEEKEKFIKELYSGKKYGKIKENHFFLRAWTGAYIVSSEAYLRYILAELYETDIIKQHTYNKEKIPRNEKMLEGILNDLYNKEIKERKLQNNYNIKNITCARKKLEKCPGEWIFRFELDAPRFGITCETPNGMYKYKEINSDQAREWNKLIEKSDLIRLKKEILKEAEFTTRFLEEENFYLIKNDFFKEINNKLSKQNKTEQIEQKEIKEETKQEPEIKEDKPEQKKKVSEIKNAQLKEISRHYKVYYEEPSGMRQSFTPSKEFVELFNTAKTDAEKSEILDNIAATHYETLTQQRQQSQGLKR